jgi:hypothetical protein
MRSNAQGMPRLEAVMYLSSAQEAYRELDLKGQKQLWRRRERWVRRAWERPLGEWRECLGIAMLLATSPFLALEATWGRAG